MTHDITIPKDQKIIFPAVCVVCGRENPDDKTDISFMEAKLPSMIEVASTLLGSAYSVGDATQVFAGLPACATCARRLKNHHRGLKIFSYVSWSLSVILAFALPVSIGWKAAVFLVFLILPAIVSIAYPPAFDATITNSKTTLHFTAKKAADAVRQANKIE
ncbi:MAG: hypothetical protein Fur0021_12390 [Candidatus Promineifilaceae bacterium]